MRVRAGHIAAVAEFFGPAISLRRSLFLADANALIAPMPRVREWLDVIDGEGVRRPGGIFSFIDAFDVGRKTVAEWAELAARGLRRVYIGMESGHDALLRFLRKPGSAADVVDAVSTLKAAKVAVSLIIMTGAGGAQHAAGHVEHTVEALRSMPLGADDIIYFSPFFEQPDSEYGELARQSGIRPLSPAETAQQEAGMRDALRQFNPAVQLSRYDIREFVY